MPVRIRGRHGARGIELPDLLPADGSHWVANEAFDQSLLWRDQSRFTKRTLALIKELLGSKRVKSVLLEVATEPKNPFNALHLHQRLEAMSMPEREDRKSVVRERVFSSV